MADKGSVTARIARYIRKNIQNGSWIIGDKIPSENQLCKELGVSRVSVRNALQQFIALGILESIHGKGTFLISSDLSVFTAPETTEVTPAENLKLMRDILEFRMIVEPEVCAMVAENPSPELLAELERLFALMQSSIGKSEAFVNADVDFHLQICQACGNPVIWNTMTGIFHRRAELGYELNLASGYYGGMYYHGLILDALRKHDSKRAKTFMLEHLRRGIDDLYADNAPAAAAPENV